MNNKLKYLAISWLLNHEDPAIIETVSKFEIEKYHKELLEDDNSKYGWFDCIPEIAQQFDAIVLTDEQLAKIDYLSGECPKVWFAIMPNWDGEGNEFGIESLDGIEKMMNLRGIYYLNWEYVPDIHKVIDLNLTCVDEFSAPDDVLEALKKKGVKVNETIF